MIKSPHTLHRRIAHPDWRWYLGGHIVMAGVSEIRLLTWDTDLSVSFHKHWTFPVVGCLGESYKKVGNWLLQWFQCDMNAALRQHALLVNRTHPTANKDNYLSSYINSPACSGSTPGPPTSRMYYILQWKVPRMRPDKLPKPTQLALFDAREQRLYSVFSLDVRTL